MRKVFFSICCMCVLFGCAQQPGFTIHGEVDGMEGDTLFLVARGQAGQWDTLGMTAVESGKFLFGGNVSQPLIAHLQGKSRRQVLPLFLENQSFQVHLNKERFDRSEITGGVLQSCYNEFMAQKAEIYKEMPGIESAFTEARKAGDRETCRQMIEKSDALDSIYKEAEMHFLRENGNTLVGIYLVYRQDSRMRFDRLSPLYDLLSEEVKQSPYGQIVTQRYQDAKITAVGEIAPDFTLLTPEGDSLSLHSLKAKVKILDFWASWCGPCRAENPKVVAIYNKYKNKGLEIISVSLDDKREAWVEAIRKDGMTWKHVSDLKGWQSIAAQLYKISSVPSIFVLDSENRIVGSYLRGQRVEECIAGLL